MYSSWQSSIDPEVLALAADAIDRCGRLPVMDRAIQRVLALTQDEQCELGELVAAVEADPALCVNLLRYANSAYVGRPIQAKTVRQAVVMIGRQATRQLCLEAVTFRFFEAAPGNGSASRGQMHVHAVSVARVASATARMVAVPDDLPHLAGLLHDCGKLVMPIAFGEDAMDEIAAQSGSGLARSEAEWMRFGLDHAHAGALLAQRSGLGEDAVTAIALHHGGRHDRLLPTREVACLQLANTVVGMLNNAPPDAALLTQALDVLDLDVGVLDELAEAGAFPTVMTPRSTLGDRVSELERLASTDELTGLANRRHWMSAAREAMESGAHGALLLCDLDHFKQINDTHGHSTGDLVLMEVAHILERHGLAGRLGGDEFAVWVAVDDGGVVAHRIVNEVASAFSHSDDLQVGVSIGVASRLRDLSEALESADEALYRAKAAGRGRAHHWEVAQNARV